MQIPTKINSSLKFANKYLIYPIIALLTSIRGSITIFLNSFKKEEEAKPIAWTFNVDELLLKVKGNKENWGLIHFLLNKLDSKLVTEEVVSNTAKYVIDEPVDLVSFAMTLLSCNDDYVKDGYEVATLRKIEAYQDRGTYNPDVALTRLAYLATSGIKCREPIAIKDFYWFIDSGYRTLGAFPSPKALPSLYVLASLAQDKSLWKRQMIWAWKLSKNEYNAFYTGLLLDAYPELLKEDSYKDYLMKCIEKLREVNVLMLSENDSLSYLSKVTMAMVALKRIQEESNESK